ncbi:MAG: hypothetical protein E6J90_39535 [Deltaproteobacteria bacterium]|nr:MAG: hypothetical protein E6J90_39535 [Deltaproteobacteria bacterium]TMQ12709.1 MAG: hypothetical protein E6J91_20345 [Deltaproteobacteria bacterium]
MDKPVYQNARRDGLDGRAGSRHNALRFHKIETVSTPLFTGASDGPSPVVSLTILDGETLGEKDLITRGTRMVVAARAAAANPTHPNVISVPTQRVPRALLHELRAHAIVKATLGNTQHFAGDEADSAVSSGHDARIYAAESILARKFELGKELESGSLRFTARLAVVVAGATTYDAVNQAPIEESIEMANLRVVLRLGRAMVPRATTSFARLGWVSVGEFITAARRGDPSALGERFDAAELAIRGLCISSTCSALEYELARSA